MSTRTPSPTSVAARAAAIHQLALSLPTAYEDTPWGFPVFKLQGNRLFAWLTGEDEGPLEVTVKMSDDERPLALALDWVRPASHLGRYGWVTAQIVDSESLDYALAWVEESWWLRAPKRLRPVATDAREPLSERGDG